MVFIVQFDIFEENNLSFKLASLQSIYNIIYDKKKIILVFHLKSQKMINLTKKIFKKNEYLKIIYSNNLIYPEYNISNIIIDYILYINTNCIIINNNVLNDLLHFSSKIISPLMISGDKNSLLSNFWGDINKHGYYKRSDNYMEIIDCKYKFEKIKVSYVNNIYLISKQLFENLHNYYTENLDKGEGHDMCFCYNLRLNTININLIANNTPYGYLIENDNIYDIEIDSNRNLFNYYKNKLIWENYYFHQIFLDYIRNNNSTFSVSEVAKDIYEFPLFNPNFCKSIIKLVNNFGNWSAGTHEDYRIQGGYENVPTQDIHFSQVGFSKIWKDIVINYISDIVYKCYNNFVTKDTYLDFVVKYDHKMQNSLEPHHDASSYSINIALNKKNIDFEGGGTHFIRQNYKHISQKQGYAIIHPGRMTHYHEGMPVTKGTRYIIISFVD